MVIGELRRSVRERLAAYGVPDAAFDADRLVEAALGLTRTEMILSADKEVPAEAEERAYLLSRRRINGEPLQYILGKWEFYGLPFYVGEGVLIPRADTEVLVDEALEWLKDRAGSRVIDLCSGSGCIAVSVAKNAPNATVTAVELYEPAFSYLKRSVELNAAEVHILKADILQKPDNIGELDIILTNPPYIETEVIGTLSREVQKEPKTALDGGVDGLLFYRAIKENWIPLLSDDGCIMAEIGEEQAEAVTALFTEAGLTCRTVRDLNGNDRVIIGTKVSV